jgi:hypothetical protein
MDFSAPTMLTVRILHLLRTVQTTSISPDPALLLKSDRVGDQPVTSARPADAVAATGRAGAREGLVGGAAQTRQRATPQTTSSTSSSAHACLRPRSGVLI